MFRPRIVAVALFSLIIAAPLYAQPKTSGNRVAALAAPLGAEEALLLIRIDTAKIDLEAGLDWAAKALKSTPEERAQMDEAFEEPREFLKAFRDAGGQELLWMIFPTPGAGREPIEVAGIATAAPGKAKAVAAFLREKMPAEQLEVSERNNTVLLASEERTRSFDGSARPSPTLIKAFDAAGEGTVQVVLQLSDDTRRVVRETFPRLPEEFGGVGGKEISEVFSWAALSIDAPPKFKLKLQVQATSADGAQSLAKVAGNWFQIAGSQEWIREAIPDFDQLVPLLTPKAEGDKVVLSLGEKPGDMEKLLPAVLAPIKAARDAALRSQHMNSFKQIGLAMHNYHDTHKRFPARAWSDKDGKPLLSWRVQILPFLDEAELYKEFRLDEPWDSEHNKKLIEKMPKVFENPRIAGLDKGQTTFLVPIAEKSIFEGKEGMKIQQITDGLSNTILAVEGDAKHAVIWTKPDDLQIDPKDPAQGLFVDKQKQTLTLFADGSVRGISVEKHAEKLPALFSTSGAEPVELD